MKVRAIQANIRWVALSVLAITILTSCGLSGGATRNTNVTGFTDEEEQVLDDIARQVLPTTTSVAPTTVPVTTTTLVPVREPVKDVSNFEWWSPVALFPSEHNRDCAKVERQISRDTKVPHEIYTCYEGWARGMTVEKRDSIRDAGYEAETLYGLDKKGRWVEIAQCAIWRPLFEVDDCYVVMRPDLEPPKPAVLCRIWEMNNWLDYISVTKCQPDPDYLKNAIEKKCGVSPKYDDDYDDTGVGVGKCRKGKVVCVIQEQMRARGYDVPVDGWYRSDLAIAVMHYQQSIGLIPSTHIPKHQWPALFPRVKYSGESSQHC